MFVDFFLNFFVVHTNCCDVVDMRVRVQSRSEAALIDIIYVHDLMSN